MCDTRHVKVTFWDMQLNRGKNRVNYFHFLVDQQLHTYSWCQWIAHLSILHCCCTQNLTHSTLRQQKLTSYILVQCGLGTSAPSVIQAPGFFHGRLCGRILLFEPLEWRKMNMKGHITSWLLQHTMTCCFYIHSITQEHGPT